MSSSEFVYQRRGDQSEIIKDNRTPKQVVLDHYNIDLIELPKRIQQVAQNSGISSLHLELLKNQPILTTQIVGKTIELGNDRWLVAIVQGLSDNLPPETYLNFELIILSYRPGKFLSVDKLGFAFQLENRAPLAPDLAFHNFTYREVQEHLAKTGVVALVTPINNKIALYGVVRSDVQSLQVKLPNQAPLTPELTNHSFLTIIGEGGDYLSYAPISLSTFDAVGNCLGHTYWPSERQLEAINGCL